MKQREIKFRAWHKENKIMYWFELLWGNHRNGDGYIGMVPMGKKQTRYIHRDNMTLVDPDQCYILQFTGLKDKNGKEIYEGDLIHRHMGVYWEVRFTDAKWQAHPKHECGLWLDYKQFEEAEIVGNIYENPELS